jgi:hypothetical protein
MLFKSCEGCEFPSICRSIIRSNADAVYSLSRDGEHHDGTVILSAEAATAEIEGHYAETIAALGMFGCHYDGEQIRQAVEGNI